MASISDTDLNAAIATTVAQQILGSLEQKHRDAFLEKSIATALKDWSVRSTIEKIVAARAAEVVEEILKEPAWTARVKAAVKQGVEAYLKILPTATAQMLAEAFHGKEGERSYDLAPGIIRKYLKLPEEKA